MPGKIAPQACPKCGGQMWDNVANKRNPKAPDFACKDKDNCGAGVWLKDSEKNALQGGAQGKPNGKRMLIIDSLMEQCIVAAKRIMAQEFPGPKPPRPDNHTTDVAADALVVNLATTMFISRSRDGVGILKVEKEGLANARAKAAEAERQRKAVEERREYEASQSRGDFEDFPGAQEDRDDDLPF